MKPLICLDLTEEEATVLVSLIGGVVWNFDTHEGQAIARVYDELDEQLPKRTKSFTDFFTGETRCKKV